MRDIIFILTTSIGLFIGNLSAGYRLDEQVSYPSDGKHTIKISRQFKRFFVFQRKKNRHLFFKAAVIQQIIGYGQLLFWWLIAMLIFITGYRPDKEVMLILAGIICCPQIIYTLIVLLFYKIKNVYKK
jgi:hypothetical protein